jgi:biopolymer transport protein ExbB
MDFASVIDIASNAVYPLQAITAFQGIFLVILLLRRIAQKRFATPATATTFMNEVREKLAAKKFDEVAELCDSPGYWSKATPQLILVALAERNRPIPKLRSFLAERFNTDIVADLEYSLSWINTVVKTAPMLGLQGTVLGMIAAFAKIASRQKSGINPADLAADISFALWTTAIGLFVAIPLVIAAAAIQVRIGRLQDSVQRQLGEFLEALESSLAEGRRKP